MRSIQSVPCTLARSVKVCYGAHYVWMNLRNLLREPSGWFGVFHRGDSARGHGCVDMWDTYTHIIYSSRQQLVAKSKKRDRNKWRPHKIQKIFTKQILTLD